MTAKAMGSFIQKTRLRRGLSLFTLSRLTEIPPPRLEEIEEGSEIDFPFDEMYRIAFALHIRPGELGRINLED